MAKVVLSAIARDDLIGIRDYIRDDLCNPDAAGRIMRILRKSIETLEFMPEHGAPLDSVIPYHTEYRYLTCEAYRIFYLYDGDTVEIIRILHNLQDYMKALF